MSKILKTDQQWREQLNDEEYKVCRQHGTESAFSGEYSDNKATGTYVCTCCGEALFKSDTKFDSGTGWPSFYQAANEAAIGETEDTKFFMKRVEVHCSNCDSHLGHVFPDGPEPTGLRYCINSVSLKLKTA